MTSSKNQCKLILALDLDSVDDAKTLLKSIGSSLEWVKVGLQLFTKYGPDVVKAISGLGYHVFLDLKLHDIPNTVASSIKSLKDLPIGLLTLHTSGGTEMMRWANEACQEISHSMKLLGVTVLTSMDQQSLNSIGIKSTLEEQVTRLGKLGMDAGLQGLVCSPLELPILRKQLGPKPLLVTPGIRPQGLDFNEQKRIMTPKEAASFGATHIVVGRPIYEDKYPRIVVKKILEEINLH